MAIDTENKRRSVQGYSGYSATVLPLPDGNIAVVDRATVDDVYSGLLYLPYQLPPIELDEIRLGHITSILEAARAIRDIELFLNKLLAHIRR